MQSQTEHTKQEIGRARARIGVRVWQRCLIKWLHYTTSASTSDTPTNKRIQTVTDMPCSPHITELEYMPICRALIKYTADIKLSNPTGHNQNIAGFHSGEGAFASPWVTAIWCNSASYKKSLIQATTLAKRKHLYRSLYWSVTIKLGLKYVGSWSVCNSKTEQIEATKDQLGDKATTKPIHNTVYLYYINITALMFNLEYSWPTIAGMHKMWDHAGMTEAQLLNKLSQ